MKTMSFKQFQELLATVTRRLRNDMNAEEAQRWIDDPNGRIHLVTNDESAAAPAPNNLFELVVSASVPDLLRFVAADNFKEDTKGAVRIWSLGDNFKKHFLQKAEEATAATEVKVSKLLKQSCDPAIMVELGSGYELTLGQFFHLLAKQGKGEKDGPLLVNGWANIAYIADYEGTVWAVSAHWSAGNGGWRVEVFSVGDPRGWYEGNQILSC